MEPKLLPPDVFLETFKLVPRVAVCLQVRGSRGEVLLSRRSETMETMPGAWHYPGGFLLVGETLEACAERVARKELGASVRTLRPAGFFEDLDGDPRGHVIDLVMEVELNSDPCATEETGALEFFASVPSEVAFRHDRIMRAAGLA
jgi:8-oxo-dGTP diphosphatase